MRVLGIDPGRRLGWAVADGSSSIKGSGAITLPQDHSRRWPDMHANLLALVQTFSPAVLAVEQVRQQHRSMAAATCYGAACALAYVVADAAGIEIMWVPVGTWKRDVVGSGAAEKRSIRAAIRRLTGCTQIASYDEADACAIALWAWRQAELERRAR